jgi:hypothetical protein
MKQITAKLTLACALGLIALAAPVLAGPQMTFGPDDQGVLQIDYKGQFQMLLRDTGAGPDNDDAAMSFNFRRNRLAFMGAYGEVMSLYVQTEYVEDLNIGTLGVADADQGAEFRLLDAVARFNLDEGFKLNVGKFKHNLTRENLEACEDPLTLDRSLFIRPAFVSTRDMGVAAWGNLAEGKFQYRLEVMEGRKAVSGVLAPSAGFRYGARAHVSLLDPESEYGYKGTYLGKKKVLTVGGSVQSEPEVVYGDVTTCTGEKDFNAYSVDAFFEYPIGAAGAFTLSAAYQNTDFDDAYLGLNPDAGVLGLNGQKNGWYAKVGYLMPTVPLQLFGRFESWNFALLNNVYDQQLDWFGVGANYYFKDDILKLTAEYSTVGFDKTGVFDGPQGDGLLSDDFATFITQLQVVF